MPASDTYGGQARSGTPNVYARGGDTGALDSWLFSGSVYATRSFYANGGSTYVGSDIRLKKDIAPITHGLSDVMNLKPVSYVLKADTENRTRLGFIAQDVKPVLPEAVSLDNSSENSTYYLSYESIIPVLTKGMQEQQQQIVTLKDQVAALQALICQDHPEAAACRK